MYAGRSEPVVPSWTTYVVQPGDTLSGIAACSGTSVLALAQTNHLENPDFVAVGARLRVPGRRSCSGQRNPPDRAARLLAAANLRLEGADFEGALSLADRCVRLGESLRPTRARCHVVAGMAAAGLDQRERAIGEFRQAFALDPTLELSADTTSPRILDLVSAARPAPAR